LSPPLKIRVSERAQTQIADAAQWWQFNRPSAPGAIRSDIAEMLVLIATRPSVGSLARSTRVAGTRRVYLRRIRYYLYYRVAGDFLDVLALWHESRGGLPPL